MSRTVHAILKSPDHQEAPETGHWLETNLREALSGLCEQYRLQVMKHQHWSDDDFGVVIVTAKNGDHVCDVFAMPSEKRVGVTAEHPDYAELCCVIQKRVQSTMDMIIQKSRPQIIIPDARPT